jgi:hypothetical protein
MEFGLIPELLGRLPVIGTLAPARRSSSGTGADRTSQRTHSAVQEDVRYGRMQNWNSPKVLFWRSPNWPESGKPGLAVSAAFWNRSCSKLMFELPELERGQKFVITEDIVQGNRKALHRGDSAAA